MLSDPFRLYSVYFEINECMARVLYTMVTFINGNLPLKRGDGPMPSGDQLFKTEDHTPSHGDLIQVILPLLPPSEPASLLSLVISNLLHIFSFKQNTCHGEHLLYCSLSKHLYCIIVLYCVVLYCITFS